MRPKGASHLGPKPQLGPPAPFLATIPLDPKMTKNLMETILAINPIGPNFGHGPPWTNSSAMASGNHKTPPDKLSPSFPSTPGVSSFPSYHLYSRLQAWRINQLINLISYGGNQKTLQGSQPPVSAVVSLAQFIEDYSREILKRYYIISISCQGIKYSILLGQLNSSIQASFNQPVWSWPNWAIPYSTVGIPSHSSNFKMARAVFPNLDNTVIDPPSRINLSVFTYTGYLSSPGDFFPS
ncbi:hypothetical protein O181_042456 [Austropuccinia psidii MF-1]|uniref:Uncharacterized protein n=1 Tax=Austropuccinia psidii MF-1 TaxID=1389203 RepID=A0A9Q3DEW6_9BASI|nr:hypothetical protein [Austropuccinia psidii MF-1]